MQTIVLDDFDTYLGKRSERAVVKRADGTEVEFPFVPPVRHHHF